MSGLLTPKATWSDHRLHRIQNKDDIRVVFDGIWSKISGQ